MADLPPNYHVPVLKIDKINQVQTRWFNRGYSGSEPDREQDAICAWSFRPEPIQSLLGL